MICATAPKLIQRVLIIKASGDDGKDIGHEENGALGKAQRQSGRDPNGWVYKTGDEWWDETSLPYKRQLTARTVLKKAGIIEERHDHLNQRLYFRVNWQVFDRIAAADVSTKERAKEHRKKGGVSRFGCGQERTPIR